MGVCAELIGFGAYHGLGFFLVRLGLEAVRGRLIISRVNCCKIFIKNNLDLVVTNWDVEILIEELTLLIRKKVDLQHQIEIATKTFTIDKMIDKVFR